MQPPTYREIIARLKSEGFTLARQRGSHATYAKDEMKVTVPGHGGKTPKKGTWDNIKRQAGW